MTNPNDRINLGTWKDLSMAGGEDSSGGLTKREYFAAMAMQGMMSLDPREMISMADPSLETVGDWVAKNSTSMADSLIEQLNK